MTRIPSFDAVKLRQLREANGWSLETAAELMGLESHVLSGVEKGTRTLSPRQWQRVFDAIGKATAQAESQKAATTDIAVPPHSSGVPQEPEL